MAKTAKTQKQKLLDAFVSGQTLTTSQAAKKFKIPANTVSKRVYDLRNEGYCIYANTVAGSKREVAYRIGTPSKAVIAAGMQALREQGMSL
jgi:biotin operon repressor